jgi:predicted AlkP superfamily pyrophosphatase or phosphodiesterase
LEKLLVLAEVVDQRVLETVETVVQVVADHGQEVIFQDEQLREILLLDMDMETMVVSQQESTTEELVAVAHLLLDKMVEQAAEQVVTEEMENHHQLLVLL